MKLVFEVTILLHINEINLWRNKGAPFNAVGGGLQFLLALAKKAQVETDPFVFVFKNIPAHLRRRLRNTIRRKMHCKL